MTLETHGTLVKDFTWEEVVEALKGIGNLKAPRLDGLPTLFYKAPESPSLVSDN